MSGSRNTIRFGGLVGDPCGFSFSSCSKVIIKIFYRGILTCAGPSGMGVICVKLSTSTLLLGRHFPGRVGASRSWAWFRQVRGVPDHRPGRLGPAALFANAAPLYWDPTGSGGSSVGGSGVWGRPVGGIASVSATRPASTPTDADFAAGSGVVTVNSAQSVGNITFDTGSSGYTVTGSTLTLTGGNITANQNATINSVLTGSNGLTQLGGRDLDARRREHVYRHHHRQQRHAEGLRRSRPGSRPGSVTANQLTLNGSGFEATTGFAMNGNRGLTVGSSGGTLAVDTDKR